MASRQKSLPFIPGEWPQQDVQSEVKRLLKRDTNEPPKEHGCPDDDNNMTAIEPCTDETKTPRPALPCRKSSETGSITGQLGTSTLLVPYQQLAQQHDDLYAQHLQLHDQYQQILEQCQRLLEVNNQLEKNWKKATNELLKLKQQGLVHKVDDDAVRRDWEHLRYCCRDWAANYCGGKALLPQLRDKHTEELKSLCPKYQKYIEAPALRPVLIQAVLIHQLVYRVLNTRHGTGTSKSENRC